MFSSTADPLTVACVVNLFYQCKMVVIYLYFINVSNFVCGWTRRDYELVHQPVIQFNTVLCLCVCFIVVSTRSVAKSGRKNGARTGLVVSWLEVFK